jgi:dTMP kinase
MFITFEGLDFCGKSTQIQLLEKYLTGRGEKVLLTREPGGTEISEKVRGLLLDKKHLGMFGETEFLLFSSARAQLVREVIIPRLKAGYYVLSDRFHDSSAAYQGYGRGLDLNIINSVNNLAIGSAIPDITFFIDLPLDKLNERKLAKDRNHLDRMELSGDDFYERVRNGYLELAGKTTRFELIDGTGTVDEIHSVIKAAVMKRREALLEKSGV